MDKDKKAVLITSSVIAALVVMFMLTWYYPEVAAFVLACFCIVIIGSAAAWLYKTVRSRLD